MVRPKIGASVIVDSAALADILREVAEERHRQDRKWGEQNHPDGTGPDTSWLLDDDPPPQEAATVYRRLTDELAKQGRLTWKDILIEEVAEAFAEADPAKLRMELVQAVAVGVAWIEKIDRHAELARLGRHVTHTIGTQRRRTLVRTHPDGGWSPGETTTVIYCTDCPLFVEMPEGQADVGAAVARWEAAEAVGSEMRMQA